MSSAYSVVLAMLAGGWLAARLRAFPENAADVLNRFVIAVCLPAVILKLIPEMQLRRELVLLAVTPWLLLPIAYALVNVLSKWFDWPHPVRAALSLCVPLGNTSFLGFPMIEALVGIEAVGLAVVYDQLGSFFILATYGLFVVGSASDAERPTFKSVLLRLIRFPPFIALLVALLPLPRPAWVVSLLDPIAATLVPLAMFAVGLKLELRRPAHPSALVAGLSLKLVVLPAMAFVFLELAGAGADIERVAVLESAMPPMVTAGALAAMAGLAPELAAALVGYGILLSLVTLPIIRHLLP